MTNAFSPRISAVGKDGLLILTSLKRVSETVLLGSSRNVVVTERNQIHTLYATFTTFIQSWYTVSILILRSHTLPHKMYPGERLNPVNSSASNGALYVLLVSVRILKLLSLICSNVVAIAL